jgi:sulfatase maturation enzyme AslB (radical SAM superfamily)
MPKCNALTNHMCVTVTGSWRPCCRFSNFPQDKIFDVSFEEYKSSDFYKKIITDMENGWASGCAKCKAEEERGHKSLRLSMNENWSGSDQIEYIELSVSNECNLMCRMCSPAYSTKWNTFVIENETMQAYHDQYTQPYISIENVFNNVDLTKLKAVKYLGGEPFVTPQVKELFEFLEKNNLLENIHFICNTNVTYFPAKFIKYFKKLKGLKVELSIDGYGEVNEYIRHGKSWDIIYENIKKWVEYRGTVDNLLLSIFSTVQAYNFHDIKNIKNLAEKFNIKFHNSLLQVPEYLSVNSLPKEYINEVLDDFNKKYLPSITYNDKFHELVKFTNDMDVKLNTNIADHNPLLKK